MQLKKCPKCYTNAYENLESYSICHVCNYHSVEGYRWGKCYDSKAYRLLISKKVGLPYDREDKDKFLRDLSWRYFSLPGDRMVVRKAILELSPFRRALIYLRFWCDYSTEVIAQMTGIQKWRIDMALIQTYSAVKQSCMENPDFSINKIKDEIERRIFPQQPTSESQSSPRVAA